MCSRLSLDEPTNLLSAIRHKRTIDPTADSASNGIVTQRIALLELKPDIVSIPFQSKYQVSARASRPAISAIGRTREGDLLSTQRIKLRLVIGTTVALDRTLR